MDYGKLDEPKNLEKIKQDLKDISKIEDTVARLLEKEGKLLTDAEIKEYAAELWALMIESGAIMLPPGNEELRDAAINAAIQNLIKQNEELKAELEKAKQLQLTVKKKPKQFLTPTDKITKNAFEGALNGTTQLLAMEKKGSKKPITTLASISYDDLPAVQISGRRELTPYDREVHDAITTLYVEGENDYITIPMIYQVMTGNFRAKPNPKAAEAISDAITKLMYSKLIIDASEEAKLYGFSSFKYDGTVLQAERIIASVNGSIPTEVLHILKTPILYDYSNKKDQIGRIDVSLLNSPVNKNEETIILQGYLYRRILIMKGKNCKENMKTILYSTIYEKLNLEAASDGALRKKKTKVRSTIATILDYWKKEGFIQSYKVNTKGKEIYSITIKP